MSRIENVENIMGEYKKFLTEKENEFEKEKVEINVIKGRIEKYEDELNTLDQNTEKKLIDEYKKSIEKEKEEIKKIESSMYKSPEKQKEEKIEETSKKDETIRKLMQEKKGIDYELTKKEIEFQSKLLDMSSFSYEYDENGSVLNGQEFRSINEDAEKIREELSNLKQAKAKCEEYINELKAPTKEIDKINEVLARKDKEETIEINEPKQEKNENSNEEPEQEKNEDDSKEEQKEDKEEVIEIKQPKATNTAENSYSTSTTRTENKDGNKNEIIAEQISENLRKRAENNDKEKNKIEISAKNDAMYINGKEIRNLGIASSILDKKSMYKRLGVNKTISGMINHKGLVRKLINKFIVIPNIKRKLDPTIINALSRKDDYSIDDNKTIAETVGMSIEEYISAINNKEELPVDLKYDLRDSKLSAEYDTKIQKYARHANKINGVEVLGLQSRNIFQRLLQSIEMPEQITETTRIIEEQDKFVEDKFSDKQENTFKAQYKVDKEDMQKIDAEQEKQEKNEEKDIEK